VSGWRKPTLRWSPENSASSGLSPPRPRASLGAARVARPTDRKGFQVANTMPCEATCPAVDFSTPRLSAFPKMSSAHSDRLRISPRPRHGRPSNITHYCERPSGPVQPANHKSRPGRQRRGHLVTNGICVRSSQDRQMRGIGHRLHRTPPRTCSLPTPSAGVTDGCLGEGEVRWRAP
jgi:hypothetical protein